MIPFVRNPRLVPVSIRTAFNDDASPVGHLGSSVHKRMCEFVSGLDDDMPEGVGVAHTAVLSDDSEKSFGWIIGTIVVGKDEEEEFALIVKTADASVLVGNKADSGNRIREAERILAADDRIAACVGIAVQVVLLYAEKPVVWLRTACGEKENGAEKQRGDTFQKECLHRCFRFKTSVVGDNSCRGQRFLFLPVRQKLTLRVPSSSSSIVTLTAFSGNISSMSSGHSRRQRLPL